MVVALLLRPSHPLIGPLPVVHVLTRGELAVGIDPFFTAAARQGFNYLVAGAIVGGLAGFVFHFFTRSHPTRSAV